MTIFYFTSTGNSLAVAKRIGGEGAALVSIPQIIDRNRVKYADARFESDDGSTADSARLFAEGEKFRAPTREYKDDVIGLIFPIYGFAMPKMCRRFIAEKKLTADYIFAVGTYGNSPGACMRNTQRKAAEHGIRIDYAESLLMVDNYLPGFEMIDQAAKLPKKKTDENLTRIVAEISVRKKLTATAGLGMIALTSVIAVGEKAVMKDTAARNYIINEKCTKCGTCAKVCPSGNISVTDKVTFGDKCEWCLGCVHLCPKNAIHLKYERSNERWRHPDVTLAEIITSNDRTVMR